MTRKRSISLDAPRSTRLGSGQNFLLILNNDAEITGGKKNHVESSTLAVQR